MTNKNIHSDTQLPSMSKLIKSTVVAICIAAVVLVSVVLPAEYGIDLTGVGNAIGLLQMGEIKVSLAQEAAMESTEQQLKVDSNTIVQEKQVAGVGQEETAPAKTIDSKHEIITVTLKPNEGKEIKLTMSKNSTVTYSWYTDGGKANFDAHADSKKLQIEYHNYEKGKLEKSEGVLVAAFDGNHGWFWRNRTSETMTVTLEFEGDYTGVLQY